MMAWHCESERIPICSMEKGPTPCKLLHSEGVIGYLEVDLEEVVARSRARARYLRSNLTQF